MVLVQDSWVNLDSIYVKTSIIVALCNRVIQAKALFEVIVIQTGMQMSRIWNGTTVYFYLGSNAVA